MSTSLAADLKNKKKKLPKEKEKGPSFFGMLVQENIVACTKLEAINFGNFLALYVFLWLIVARFTPSIHVLLIYPVILLYVMHIRGKWKEKERVEIAHRIPFFADSVANALSVGCTLEQAFAQSVYYLHGNFKKAFELIMLKMSLGHKLGPLLRSLDNRYPKTGFKYLICLLEEYTDLGIGISPLLKRISDVLKVREESEEKIRTILSAGSTYARMSLAVFGLSFLSFGVLMKEQIHTLLSDQLRTIFILLIEWSVAGMAIVLRMTSLEFTNHYALRPIIKPFMARSDWTIDSLFDYCGFQDNVKTWKDLCTYAPLLVGLIFAYVVSLQGTTFWMILVFYAIGYMIGRFCVEFILKGMVEDQLIQAVETFPDFLQIFVIGLNSGLNQFKAFEFAETAVEKDAPELLRKELSRTKIALISGQDHEKAWEYLMERLPFETIIDFSELMIISPLHGESIIKNIDQIMSGYQTKKLNLVEKKATKLGQMVIPVIVVAFFPVFLFAVFGPLWVKITALF